MLQKTISQLSATFEPKSFFWLKLHGWNCKGSTNFQLTFNQKNSFGWKLAETARFQPTLTQKPVMADNWLTNGWHLADKWRFYVKCQPNVSQVSANTGFWVEVGWNRAISANFQLTFSQKQFLAEGLLKVCWNRAISDSFQPIFSQLWAKNSPLALTAKGGAFGINT